MAKRTMFIALGAVLLLTFAPEVRSAELQRSTCTAPGTAATITAPGAPCVQSTDFDAKNHWLIDRGDGHCRR